MYQVVKPIVPPGAHILTQSKMEQESPSVKKDDIKYLPCAVEHTGNYFGTKDLSSRCISPVMNEKDNDDFYVHLAKNIVFTLDRTYFDSIDELSWRNIADSLKFSGIDTLEKATAMDLKVCPPCPVFHTWAALHGTTIFDGKNNPERLNGLNYVQRILKEGTELSKNDIPLFIVFSDKALKESQINEMKASFKDHDNILCISLETDLQLKFPKELDWHTAYMGFMFMDCIRIVVSQHITKTINFCIDKAKSENKINLANRFEKLGTNFLFYSDIDNQWLSKPPYIIASHGMFTQPTLSETLPLYGIKDCDADKLFDDDKSILTRHRSFFSDFPYHNTGRTVTWSSDKAKNLFDYILSGEAESNFKHLSNQIAHISSKFNYLLRIDKGVSWKGDNSCFFVADHSKDVFYRGASKRVSVIDLHEKPDGKCANPDPYYREAHSLVGMQLLKYYSHGHDFTWWH
ncbi:MULTISPECIES: hypothetical protein [unclassified Endozoicomonas]|uniref:hypothetical protein n=1 Tax=unclassified Endozoicomonas TaxID=2644528 RepID=UPI003BB5E6A7